MENTHPAEPIAEPIETAPTPETKENSVIRQMREALEAANKQKKDLEQQYKAAADKLKAKEDAELTELEKLKRDLSELSPAAQAAQKYEAKLTALYESELEGIPEDKRSLVASLSATGDASDRLEALRAAKALLGSAPTPPPVPQAMGGHVAPATKATATTTAKPIDPKTLSWADVFPRG